MGLNFLLNEQPDRALDVFIKMLEVDSDTVETHLALGSLFRRRGEVDRAIRIHQNLIARPHLNKQQRKNVLTCITDESSCFSLWTVVRSGSRENYQLGIIQKSEQDATHTNATPVEGLPGTESDLQPVRHFLW